MLSVHQAMKQGRICLRKLILIASLLLLAACSEIPQLPPLGADATIIAFGDSLTYGTGAAETESYPAILARLTGRKVFNAGVPGEVSAGGVLRLPEVLERERPALLILCHGGNDLLGRQDQRLLAENMRVMLRMVREQGVPVILIAVPTPDLSLKPPVLYEDLSSEFNIPLETKALPHILSKRNLKSDYIHPNANGYRQLAEALFKLLKKSGALAS